MKSRIVAIAGSGAVALLLGGSLVAACDHRQRDEIVVNTATPFAATVDPTAVNVAVGDDRWSQTYFASVDAQSVDVLNVLLITPRTTFDYDPDQRTFRTTLDYANTPNSGTLIANATYWRLSLGLESFVYLAAPGTFGSGGPLAAQHQALGAQALNAALDQIKAAYNATHVNLAGQSSTAALAAAMMAGRDDLRCVALASGAYDQASLVAENNWPSTYLGASDPFSVERIAETVRPQPGRRIYILFDSGDEVVSPDHSRNLHRSLEAKNLGSVLLQEVVSKDARHHDLTSDALALFASCQDS